jgi:predicted TIM-barrel fold metal-dependent hydrolase
MTRRSRSSEIHDQLGHPVIDCDGHMIDFMPALEDYVREFAGPKGVAWYRRRNAWYDSDPATRQREHLARPVWWGYPTANTVDHVTALLPALLEERLGEMGIDFTVIYPSPTRTGVPHLQDDELRQPMCRALNTYQADLLRPHAQHMTPAAVIPMHSPAEAIEELEHAVCTLGMKATQMASFVQRPTAPNGSAAKGPWWDNLSLDSAHDYDPVWAKCRELRVAPGFHSGTSGLGSRISSSNSIYNHIGHFAAGQESVCKAMVLSGVTYRFPDLKVAFLESGVAWAALLYADLAAHFEKRNPAFIKANYAPELLDYGIARDLFERYGNDAFRSKLEHVGEIADRLTWPAEATLDDLDEFAPAGIGSLDDLARRFTPNFFFGCEGEDRGNLLAYDERLLPAGQRLKLVFGSDIGHMDVTDLSDVLAESYELVEQGLLTTEAFRQMMFENAIDLLAGTNPEFFTGTAVDGAVRDELAGAGR